MNTCTRLLDPVDAEALASGAPPVVRADAAEHARVCPDCAQAVDEASRFAGELDRVGQASGRVDIADRVLRLRAFSSRERRSFSIWRAPVLEGALLFSGGLLCLLAPGVSPREQAGLGAAAVVPFVALLRAFGRSLAESAAALPSGLEALSGALRGRARSSASRLFCFSSRRSRD